MSRPLFELETVMRQLIVEHRGLLAHLEGQEAAMKAFDLKQMDAGMRRQEAFRSRIAALEGRRRGVVAQIGRGHGIDSQITMARLAEWHPERRAVLLGLRDELKGTIEQVTRRTFISGKLASAVLGHLNTAIRLLAGAVEKAGLYTKQGTPRVSARIGVMEAVG